MSTMKNEESIEGKREGKHLHEKLLSPFLCYSLCLLTFKNSHLFISSLPLSFPILRFPHYHFLSLGPLSVLYLVCLFFYEIHEHFKFFYFI